MTFHFGNSFGMGSTGTKERAQSGDRGQRGFLGGGGHCVWPAGKSHNTPWLAR